MLSVISQQDYLMYSHNLGRLKSSAQSKHIINALGTPDTIIDISVPTDKIKPYYELKYNDLGISFKLYCSLGNKLKKAKLKVVEIYDSSEIIVNNLKIAEADTNAVFQNFGLPRENDKFYEGSEITLDYHFIVSEKGLFIRLSFEENKFRGMEIYYMNYKN